jgi:hypothetical protein
LNQLARQDLIIVVTSVKVDGEGLDVVKAALPAATEKEGGKGDGGAAVTAGASRGDARAARRAAERAAAAERAKEKEKEKENEKPKEAATDARIPSRQERVICGPSKAAPARVKIELDVYRFKE